jgi:hypothetical protein
MSQWMKESLMTRWVRNDRIDDGRKGFKQDETLILEQVLFLPVRVTDKYVQMLNRQSRKIFDPDSKAKYSLYLTCIFYHS